MSVSPQSLARTRDKRNLRIPRKFEDFSPDYNQVISSHTKGSSRIKSPSPPATKTISPDSAPPKRPQPKQKNIAQATSENLDQRTSISSPQSPLNQVDIDLECREATLAEPVPFRPPDANPGWFEKILGGVKECEYLDKSADSVENLEHDHSFSSTKVQQTNQGTKKNDDNVVKKSPFHPSITISNGIRISGPVTKLLAEKKPSSMPAVSSTPSSIPPSPKPASRKKARGFSLMLKPPTNNGGQGNSTDGTQINSASNRPISNQQQQRQLQQTKYYNNLSQNMQYGARLMINEPIYLPRSVASIAPITATLQQIANQARKPPFLSKKAEAYMAYQDERKFDYIASSYSALQRITKYLEVKDLLNLRLVNKTWKSIVDSDSCWKEVKVGESKINDWEKFIKRLAKYGTTDLIFNERKIEGDSKWIIGSMILLLCPSFVEGNNMRRIWIRTVDEKQNKFAIELAYALNIGDSLEHDITVEWQVKVIVDECGIALIPTRLCGPSSGIGINATIPKLVGDPEETVLVELSDLEDLFNGVYDIRKKRPKPSWVKSSSGKLTINIKPI